MISIVVPSYNCADWIAASVESCLEQQVDDEIEVIVVDDASSDNTPDVLARFQVDPRLRVFRESSNRGPAACRNRGIELASGDYIALLDADDRMLPGRLQAQLEALRSNEERFAICCCWTREVDTNGRVKRVNRFRTGANRRRDVRRVFLGQISAITPTLFFRRSRARSVGGFDENLRYREDSDFILKMLADGDLFTVPRVLVVRQLRDDGMSNLVDPDSFLESRRRFARSALVSYPFLEARLAHFWARADYILARKLRRSDRTRSRRLLWRSLRSRPTVKALAALVLELLGGWGRGGLRR